jgi:hypothetical protein
LFLDVIDVKVARGVGSVACIVAKRLKNIRQKFSQIMIEQLRALLKDDFAVYGGNPHWNRSDDPALYDAIMTLRDYFIRKAPEELPFDVGSSFIRQMSECLRYHLYRDHFLSESEKQAITLIEERLKQAG